MEIIPVARVTENVSTAAMQQSESFLIKPTSTNILLGNDLAHKSVN